MARVEQTPRAPLSLTSAISLSIMMPQRIEMPIPAPEMNLKIKNGHYICAREHLKKELRLRKVREKMCNFNVHCCY